jgi:hypothetical protein
MEKFGTNLGFSADGNVMVGAALVESETTDDSTLGQVRAYEYLNDTDEWKPLGQFIDTTSGVLYADEILLSPNGKFLAIGSFPSSDGTSIVRVFSLNSTATDATNDVDDDEDAVVVWEQIGTDITSPPNSSTSGFGHALSLTDNLVLAVSDYNPEKSPGKIHTFSCNATAGDWVRMGGQELIEHYGNSLRLVVQQQDSLDDDGSTMLLAVGGRHRARTFRF